MLIPQLSFGGAERVFHDLAREFTLAGHHVRECVFQTRTQAVDFPTQHELIVLDAPDAGSSPWRKLLTLGQRVKQLRQLKQDLAIDVCISHLEGADYINLLSRGKAARLLCIHNSKQHDPGYQGATGWLRRRLLMPALYRRASRIITVSRDLRQEMIAYLGLQANQVVTINNFIEPSLILQKMTEPLDSLAEKDFLEAGPVLLAAGRLGIEKNMRELLPVLAQLRHKYPTLRLLLLGDGVQREQLLADARQLGLIVWNGMATGEVQPAPRDCAVMMPGFRTNPFKYLAHATISVLPSLTEGFPMSLCEALTCGIPVASADCQTGPREILAPSTPPSQYANGPEWAAYGLLLPVLRREAADYKASLSAWIAGLGELLANPARRQHYVTQAKRRAADFGPKPAMVRWESLLQQADVVI